MISGETGGMSLKRLLVHGTDYQGHAKIMEGTMEGRKETKEILFSIQNRCRMGRRHQSKTALLKTSSNMDKFQREGPTTSEVRLKRKDRSRFKGQVEVRRGGWRLSRESPRQPPVCSIIAK